MNLELLLHTRTIVFAYSGWFARDALGGGRA